MQHQEKHWCENIELLDFSWHLLSVELMQMSKQLSQQLAELYASFQTMKTVQTTILNIATFQWFDI